MRSDRTQCHLPNELGAFRIKWPRKPRSGVLRDRFGDLDIQDVDRRWNHKQTRNATGVNSFLVLVKGQRLESEVGMDIRSLH